MNMAKDTLVGRRDMRGGAIGVGLVLHSVASAGKSSGTRHIRSLQSAPPDTSKGKLGWKSYGGRFVSSGRFVDDAITYDRKNRLNMPACSSEYAETLAIDIALTPLVFLQGICTGADGLRKRDRNTDIPYRDTLVERSACHDMRQSRMHGQGRYGLQSSSVSQLLHRSGTMLHSRLHDLE